MYKVTKVTAKALLRALSADIEDEVFGICWHVHHAPRTGLDEGGTKVFAAANKYLMYLFEQWPEFSGEINYPVPYGNSCPHIGYDNTYDKWDENTEYGRARHRLRQFCIDQCKLRLAIKKDA